MGALTQLAHEKYGDKTPALLFDDVPDYPKGFRNLYGHFSTTERIALTLGLPQGLGKVGLVRAYQEKIAHLEGVPPVYVDHGPILENVHLGDDINVLEFPAPHHHARDCGRYIGTACTVVTQDPDHGWYNLGTYRSKVYDGKTVGCQITEGKHGRIHRDIYFERGQPMKVAIVVGQDPLLYMLGASPVPEGISEYEYAGAIKGKPVNVVKGVYTGFPVPADAEIVIEGDTVKGDVLDEGPFGEWTGYYCSNTVQRPCVRVKSIMHRNNPIICNAPQHRPVDETVLLKAVTRSAAIWEALRLSGIPEIRGVWQHEGGAGVRFTVISIKQRYPGHARQVLHVASSCQAGAYNGKWTVVVDDDINPSDMARVLWAMSTRFDPAEDIDIIRKAWSSGRDPLVIPNTGNFNNRILIDACIPYGRLLKGDFPPVVDVPAELAKTLTEKWKGSIL
jgi:4-hydroxy-3-polyprenylbenzoate decarboxylase